MCHTPGIEQANTKDKILEKSGRYEILTDLNHEKYRHPLKVVFEGEDDRTTIVMDYPLNKGRLL